MALEEGEHMGHGMLVQTAAINTMRHLAMVLRLAPALWIALASWAAYTAHGVVQAARRGVGTCQALHCGSGSTT